MVLNGICRAYYVDGDGNDITRKMLNLLDKWETEGILIREPEDEDDKKKKPKPAPAS